MTNAAYNNREYSLAFQEYHPPFWLSFWSNKLFFENYKRITGTDVAFIYITKSGELTGFMQADGPEVIYNSIKARLNKKWMNNEINHFQKLLWQLKNIIEASRKKFEHGGLQDKIKQIFIVLSQIYPYSNSFYLLSQEIEKIVLNKLTAKVGQEKANQIIVQSSTPLKKTTIVEYSKDIQAIASKLKKRNITTIEQIRSAYTNTDLKKAIENLQKKYFCLTALNGEERTVESIMPDICQAITKDKQRQKKIPVPKDVAKEMYLLRAMVYFKDEISSFIIPYVRFGLKNEWSSLAKKLGLTFEELTQLRVEETIGLLPLKNTKQLVNERRKATFFLHEPPNMTSDIFEGEKAKEKIRNIMNQISDVKTDIDEIKGTVGSSGKVKGVVQNITSIKDISTFKEGKILVTVYTAPEFVPAMKKAIAIITDTGGITSHAALVARELNKPCIVGTKIATKIFKDGDLVEVDADKGIVRRV